MLTYHVWDVFTETPFAGNPLAIVEGADTLSTAQMQGLAREFNLSETIFLMAPADPGHTARARIFFPTAEIPFAGHPTIGAALFLHGKLGLTEIMLEEEAGLVPVRISAGAATFTAPVAPVACDIPVPLSLAAAALGLDEAAFGPHVPGVHEGGPRFLYLPVRDRVALAAARPCEPAWSALMAACAVDSAYLYTPDFHARMFSPTAGIPEDPATGSASAILASQLRSNGARPEGPVTLHQGEDMGRPSKIILEIDGSAVRITGTAVPIASGQVRVPQGRVPC